MPQHPASSTDTGSGNPFEEPDAGGQGAGGFLVTVAVKQNGLGAWGVGRGEGAVVDGLYDQIIHQSRLTSDRHGARIGAREGHQLILQCEYAGRFAADDWNSGGGEGLSRSSRAR